MPILLLGLIIFLATHSLRIFADDWRTKQIERLGEKRWKGVFALASAVGFVLLVWGFSLARVAPIVLYAPPPWLKAATIVLMVPAFLLLTAAYVPGNSLKAALGHPMLLSVKVWAFAHLLATGSAADVLLFGGFLAWAVTDYAIARRRDRRRGVRHPRGTARGNAIVLVVGLLAWWVFAHLLHRLLIGVSPFSP
jgi:uncharacterized membrane protein